MPLVLTILALVVLFGGGAAAISLYGKVRHRERAAGCSATLQAALDDYEVNGPVPIQIDSGERSPPQQLELWAYGRAGDVVVDAAAVRTYAKHAWETAHGKRKNGAHAFDFAVLVNGKPIYPDAGDPWLGLYDEVADFFRARGFVVGRDWKKRFPPEGDIYHVEDAGWRNDPLT